MQKMIYFISAFSPQRRKTLARVGLSLEDTRTILDWLPSPFIDGQKPRALPPELYSEIASLIFGDGLPEGCIFFIYKKKLQSPKLDAERDLEQVPLLKIS